MTPFKLKKKVYNLTVLSQGVPPSSLHRQGSRSQISFAQFHAQAGLLRLRSPLQVQAGGKDTYQAVSLQLSQVLGVGGAEPTYLSSSLSRWPLMASMDRAKLRLWAAAVPKESGDL